MKAYFDEIVNRRGTYCTQWDYVEDRFDGKDLLPFSISDMDFLCFPEILDQLKMRVEHGIFGYTRWNHADFKGSIQSWYQERFETQIAQETIVYSPSVSYTISKLIQQLTEVGDHIVVQTPAYDAFFKIIEGHNRILAANKLIAEAGRFTIDFKDLETKLSNPKAKILLLCSPHNPTGRVWCESELKEILALCEKYNVFIISDEIHMDVILKPYAHLPILKLATHPNNICICTSASKTFNTPGLGGSYAIIPDERLRDQFLFVLKNQDGLSSASNFGIISLMAAYEFGGNWVDEMNDYIKENMKLVAEFLSEHYPDILFEIPESTYLAWIDVRQLPYSSEELQNALVQIGKVAIMPGETYGVDGVGYLRFNVGCPRSKVTEGLKRFKLALDYLNQKTMDN